MLSVVTFYGEKAIMKERRQLGLLGFIPGFADSATDESSALFTPFLKQG